MLIGLVETIRFGFSPLGTPTGIGLSEQKTQGGLPPGAIRFGFKPKGSVITPTVTSSGGPWLVLSRRRFKR